MHMLGIHYHFPPVKTVGSLRLYNFYHHLPTQASPPVILTSSLREKLRKDPAMQPDRKIRVIQLPAYDLRNLIQRGYRTENPHLPSVFRRSRIARWLALLQQSFPFNLLFGDGGLPYILAGYSQGKRLITENGITHLFSSYRPYSDHAIAYLLKRRFPELVWIADFRDLHVDPSRKNVLIPYWQAWCNRKIVAKASLLTTVSEGLAHNLKQYHPHVYVLRNGMGGDPAKKMDHAPPPADPPARGPSPKFTITYTGSLYPERQSAAPLFRVIGQLIEQGKLDPDGLRLVYAGKDQALWNSWLAPYGLSEFSENLGLVDLLTARQIQAEANINLLLSWTGKGQTGILTAKLYEYLAVQRPVLCLVKGIRDPELVQLIETSGAGKIMPLDPDPSLEIRTYLLHLLQIWEETGDTKASVDAKVLRDIRWPTMMKRFFAHLKSHAWA